MSKLETQVFDASEAKNRFGALIDAAQRRPVTIKRRGRAVAFVLSPADMETIEDMWLGARAMEIMRTGKFLGIKKTREYFDSVLKKNARN
ncbi:MAG: type II toxin-antitoxin system prevent-host-death family antitoxin [bacterium]|nr:type II toxin-antitoxin system prevent-host-death family antitoxin [bacterium]